MLKIDKLTKYYGDIRGVENLSLEIKEGEIFGFIGPNGAGKSTTIKCIMNTINKNSGEIYINGVLDTKDNTSLKELIGYLPGEIHLYDDLTVQEMINYSASFYRKTKCIKRAKELTKMLELNTKKKIEELSLGNLKKLGIVLSLMHEPKLLILDEATSGLDPLMQEVFYSILLNEKEKGTTIFFSSHILSEIKRICDRVGIIKDGTLIKVEDVKSLFSGDFSIVTIESKDIDKIKKEIPDLISDSDSKIKFMYKNNCNDLVKMLGKYDIDKFLVEDPSIEDIFMHYYK